MELPDALQQTLQWADAALAWLVTKAPLATAGSAIVAAVIAVRSFHKWKTETVGKRNIELAEDILAGFYNARAVLEWARFPGSTGGEGQTRPGRGEGGEGPEAQRQRDAYFWPIERLLAEKDFFNSMQARKYRAMAAFGPEHAKEFNELKQFHGKVISAAGILIRMSRADGKSDLAKTEKWESIIGHGADIDEQGNVKDPFADEFALAGDAFYDALISHPNVEKTYLNWAAAADLREDKTWQSFPFGGIIWHNYRGTDDNSTVAVPTNEAKFFPVGARDIFKKAQAPAEFGPYVNTLGLDTYAINIPDRDRQLLVDVIETGQVITEGQGGQTVTRSLTFQKP